MGAVVVGRPCYKSGLPDGKERRKLRRVHVGEQKHEPELQVLKVCIN